MHIYQPDEPIEIIVIAQAIGWPVGDTWRWLKSLGVTHRFRGAQIPALKQAHYTTLADLQEKAPQLMHFFEVPKESQYAQFTPSSKKLLQGR